MVMPMKLALGTAQLGMSYGVANRSGQPDSAEARAVVAAAWAAGFRYMDTAQAYGESERVLGACLGELGLQTQVAIISKFAPTSQPSVAGSVVASIRGSLARLQVPGLHACLLHHENMLEAWTSDWYPALQPALAEGLLQQGGASVYAPERARQALALEGIGIVQLACNVMDRRLFRHGVLAAARQGGKQLMLRSLFLQGLLLMAPQALPARLGFATPAVQAFHTFCAGQRVAPLVFALGYVHRLAPDAILVLGAERASQVVEMAGALAAVETVSLELCQAWDAYWPDDDLRLINPAQWPPA